VSTVCSPFQHGCANVKDDETVGMSCLEVIRISGENPALEVNQARATSRESDSVAYYLNGLMGDLLRQRIGQNFRMLEFQYGEEQHARTFSSA